MQPTDSLLITDKDRFVKCDACGKKLDMPVLCRGCEGSRTLQADKPKPAYQVVIATDAERLAIKVDNLLALGWRLAGGVTVTNMGFYQAMEARHEGA